MNYWNSLSDQERKEVKIAILIVLFVVFIIYLLPSGFINKYKISLGSQSKIENSADVKFDPYNSGLSAVVRSMGDTTGSRPAWQNIIMNSDPLISATDTAIFATDESVPDPSTSNISDLVARDIYVADQALITSSSSDDKAAIASGLTTSVANFVKAKVYTAADIKIITDNSIPALKLYGEKVTLATQKVDKIDTLKQYEALQNYASSNNEEYLLDLEGDISIIKKTIGDLLIVSTPSKLAKNHIELINLYSIKLTSFTNISLSKNDPIRGLVAMSTAEQDIDTESKVLSSYLAALQSLGLDVGIITK